MVRADERPTWKAFLNPATMRSWAEREGCLVEAGLLPGESAPTLCWGMARVVARIRYDG